MSVSRALASLPPRGYNNTILHCDGAQWRSQPVPGNYPSSATITSVSALAGDNVWAAGSSFFMKALHYDGTQWSKVPSITGNQWGVSALDRNHVWLVGLKGCIAFFDGTQGQRQDQKANTLRAVSASAPDNAWAVGGEGIILHWNGTGWRRVRAGRQPRRLPDYGSRGRLPHSLVAVAPDDLLTQTSFISSTRRSSQRQVRSEGSSSFLMRR
jgi:photosystem II stability/assembly factor-like uncharacterized protein